MVVFLRALLDLLQLLVQELEQEVRCHVQVGVQVDECLQLLHLLVVHQLHPVMVILEGLQDIHQRPARNNRFP